MNLNVNSFGLALGLTSVVGVILLGLLSYLFGIGGDLISLMSSLYLGYAVSIQGMIVGSIWAFIDGFVMGVILATIYNKLL